LPDLCGQTIDDAKAIFRAGGVEELNEQDRQTAVMPIARFLPRGVRVDSSADSSTAPSEWPV
jgi:hypothetical protein